MFYIIIYTVIQMADSRRENSSRGDDRTTMTTNDDGN